jgi:hypothetical protein
MTLPITTASMVKNALQFGIDAHKPTPPKPFKYDGCTFFPDSFLESDFTLACLNHDIAYWHGGTQEERAVVDQKLKAAIYESGFFGKMVTYPVYFSVRLFGDSFLTKAVSADWGFGW